MIINAPTLDEAYQKACDELNCSIVELDIEVIQNPTAGFLGMFKKEAIIKINLGQNQTKPKPKATTNTEDKKVVSNKELSSLEQEISSGIEKLLDSSCYDAKLTSLSIDSDTVSIIIDGSDAALMIGKEGYRYKAFSYIFHNWIKLKYNLNISLEIAQFYKNQKENIKTYIEIIKERVQEQGRAQTKPLDGILVKIALEELRALYPDMYVAIKTLRDGKKVIVVNEHRRKR